MKSNTTSGGTHTNLKFLFTFHPAAPMIGFLVGADIHVPHHVDAAVLSVMHCVQAAKTFRTTRRSACVYPQNQCTVAAYIF